MSGEPAVKSVAIPIELYNKIEEVVNASNEFSSVEEYVLFVLQEVLSGDDEQKSVFNKDEEAEVKKRLKALGYLV